MSSEEISEAIKVAVRLRPLVPHEKGQQPCLTIRDADVSVIPASLPDGDKSGHGHGPWRFDHALDSSKLSSRNYIDNAKLYNVLGRNIVQHAIDGFNSCLFCYGQTGTGKTTTVLGDKQAGPGLLILLLKDLFDYKSQETEKGNSMNIAIQMLEVYNEKVYDLLHSRDRASSKESLSHDLLQNRDRASSKESSHASGRERACLSDAGFGHGHGHGHGDSANSNVELHVLPTGVQIKGAELRLVDSVQEVLRLIEHGNKRKHMAATAMNPQSSRGHTVFKLVIQRDHVDDGVHLHSEIYFADLAGHEDEKTTKVTGDRLVELSFINKSLMWLQSAIHAMAVASKGKHAHGAAGAKHKNPMVLFRNSKLTLLLANALLSNSLVNVIVTISPAAAHFGTSLSSLRFANEVKRISVDVHSSAHVDPNIHIRQLEAEVRRLQEQLDFVDPDIHIRQLEAEVRHLKEQLALATSGAHIKARIPPSRVNGGTGGPCNSDENLLSKLQACTAENERLRRDIQESQACLKALHIQLRESHEHTDQLQALHDQLLSEYRFLVQAAGTKSSESRCQSRGQCNCQEVGSALGALNSKFDELFRDLRKNACRKESSMPEFNNNEELDKLLNLAQDLISTSPVSQKAPHADRDASPPDVATCLPSPVAPPQAKIHSLSQGAATPITAPPSFLASPLPRPMHSMAHSVVTPMPSPPPWPVTWSASQTPRKGAVSTPRRGAIRRVVSPVRSAQAPVHQIAFLQM